MSTRLSPAASLLRNSKLFALPQAVSLPPVPPSSDQVSQSETATTNYPTHAAIEAPSIALSRGDWGFKRQLPLKSTTKSGNPSVRLVRGIDTPEHVADFESASDHVLTLRKFQELSHPLRLPQQGNRTYDRRDFSVFRGSFDNTTNFSSTAPAYDASTGTWPSLKQEVFQKQLPEHLRQKQSEIDELKRAQSGTDPDPPTRAAIKPSNQIAEMRRWKYAGPSLLKMSGMEFDAFLKTVGAEHRLQLRERAKQELIRERTEAAREEGSMDAISSEVSEQELSDYMRELRGEPKKFGPLIAEILDLPEGQPPPIRNPGESDPWEYGRDTLAAGEWREKGPPRTHPSAGLSYVHSNTISNNHPKFGPQKTKAAVLARAVKHKLRSGPPTSDFGVAGFVVPRPITSGVNVSADLHESLVGGLKAAVIPGPAFISEDGALNMSVTRTSDYINEDNKAMHQMEVRQEREERGDPDPEPVRPAPQMSRPRPTRRATEIKKREVVEPSQDVDKVLQEMMEFRKAPKPQT